MGIILSRSHPNSILQPLNKLSENLSIDVGKGKITRIDVGYNILVDYPPPVYYPYLGETRYFTRIEQPKSIYYTNVNRQIVIYDKIQESKEKKEVIPSEFNDKNLLRIEYRFKRYIEKRLQWKPLSLTDLWNEKFILNVENLWKNGYHQIHKITPREFDISLVKKPNDFFDQLILEGIQSLGGANEVNKKVEQMKSRKQFNNSIYYSRIKSKIKSLSKASEAHPSTSHELLIDELNRKVDQVSFF